MPYQVKAGWFIDLSKKLSFYNNRGEIEQLCNALKIDFNAIRSQKLHIQVQEIIGAMIFRNELSKLIGYLKKNRPRSQPYAYHRINLDDIQKQAEAALRLADPLLEVDYSGPAVAIPPKGVAKTWYHEFAEVLETYYDDDEFRQMCTHFRINDAFTTLNSKKVRAIKVVEHGLNYGIIGKIVKYCRQNRPRVQPMKFNQIPWDTFETRAKTAVKSGNALNDPIAAAAAYLTFS
ncbi:MAG: hypothetical protein AAGD96_30615 [Chloroflexota bacterium]